MNMISTGAFQIEMDASNKTETLVSKLVSAWEKKNAKVARAGGVSLMALSLAACGSSDDTASDDTSSSSSSSDDTTTTTTTPTAQTFTLTSGLDAVTGGSGDDAIYGAITAAATTTTLEAYDRIDMGAGTDTFVLTLSGGNYVGDTSIAGVENFTVQASGAGRSFDADALEGMAKFTVNQSSQNMTVTNMESVDTDIHIYKDSTANTTSITFKNAALAGSDDTVDLNLNRVTAIEAVTLAGDGANDIENVNIVSEGSVKNFMGALTVEDSGNVDGMAKLTISGSAALDMDAAALDFAGNATTSTATLDASAMTGALLVDADDADANIRMTITTGSGDDTLDMGDSLNSLDTVDMGAGTDTIKIDSLVNSSTTTLTSTYNLTGVENVQVAGADEASITIAAAGQAGLEKVIFVENADGGNDNGDAYTVTGLAAGVDVQLTNSVNSRDANTLTISLADASGSADSLTVITAGTSGHGTDNNMDDIAISDIETLTINSIYAGATAMTATEFNVIDDISADTSLTTINVTGTEKTNITVGAEATNLALIDASASGDGLTVDVSALTSNTSIIGTGGNDTFTVGTTLTNADTFDGKGQGTAATDGDTLTATIAGLTAESGALSIANVEDIRLDTATSASLINATGITGSGTTVAFASGQNVTISNLAAGVKVGLGYGADAASDDYTGTLTASLADETGTADSITFELTDQAANNAINATLKTASTTLESATINLGSDNDTKDSATLNVANLKVGTLTLTNASTAGANTAAETMTLGTLSSLLTTLDASSFIAKVSATGGAATATTFKLKGGVVHDVTGSTAADTFDISTTNSNTAYNIDGGAGTDTLTLNMGTATFTDTNVDNFEVINYVVGSSKDAVVTTASGKGINDNDTTTVNVSGGNAISSLSIGATTVLGAAAGGEATGLVTFNAADFKGNLSASFGDSVVDTALTITGGSGADKLYATYDAAATEVIKVSAIEKIHLLADRGGDSGETYTFNMANVSGASLVSVSAGAASADDTTITLSNLAAGQTIAMGSTAANGIAAGVFYGTTSLTGTLASATGTADALTLNLVDTDENAGVGTDQTDFNSAGLESLTINVANSDEDHDIDLAGVTATTGSNVAIVVTGGKDATTDDTVDAGDGGSLLQIADMSSTTNSFDASAFLGNILMSGRHSNSMTATTGVGDDTVRMENSADVLTGGAGTDTLVVAKAAILGGLNIDLTNATDQIVSFNGSASSGTVLGFENVDASGYTGNFGAAITAHANGSTLTGTANTDEFTLTTGKADIVNATDQVATATTVKVDTINNFTTGTGGDKIKISIADLEALTILTQLSEGNASDVAAGDTVVVETIVKGTAETLAVGDNIFAYTNGTAADVATLVADIDGGGTTALTFGANPAAKDGFLVIYSDGTDAYVAVVSNSDATDSAAIDDGELSGFNLVKLTGITSITDGQFVAGNFDFVA